MKKLCGTLVTLFILSALGPTPQAQEARLLRFPDVSKEKVAFSYAGDIYIAPRTGGQAIRLTSDDGLELFARFSPDGRKIAFTGQYDGDWDVYVMPVDGGQPRRLTFHPGIQITAERFGPENVVMGWNRAGDKVLYRSRKESMTWWDGRVYLVSEKGGMSEPLPMSVAGFTSFSPDGNEVAYCPIYRDFRTWKRYKGGMAQDVWTFNLKSLQSKKITDWEGTDNMPMWYRDRIYFNSDRSGTLNLYCYDTATGQTRQVTKYTEFDVRWPSLGPDAIAFENGGYLYVMDLPSETVHKVDIQLTFDRHTMRSEYAKVGDKIAEFDISPDGKRAVFQARGDIFTVPAKEGDARNLTNSSSSKEMYPTWSPDGKWVAYLSDRTGEDEFYITSQDGKETIQLTTGSTCHRYQPLWSPDSKRLVFPDKNLKLFYIDVASKQVVDVDSSKFNEIRDVSCSPDSRYLAYVKRLDNRISAVFVYSFDDKSIHQVTPGLTNDYSPVFDPDGKYLYFLSERNFNPILGSYEFSFVNNSITNLFLIVLRADTTSPFAPRSDEVALSQVSPQVEKGKTAKEEKKEEVKAPVVKIDFDGIYEREVSFDLPSGNYDGVSAISGAIFYMSYPISGLNGPIGKDKPQLYKYDLEKRKNNEFLSDVRGYSISADHKKMLVRQADGYYIIDTDGKEADLKDKGVDVTRMDMKVDHEAEYVQMYNQVWRRLRDFFYDKNMHGVDWKKIHDRYAALLPYVANRFDLTYVMGEMVGELCSSHTYVGDGEMPVKKPNNVGLLGVDFEIDQSSNRIRIQRILEGENWDRGLRSPLRDPGIDIAAGDYLLAIDGREVTGDIDPYSLTEDCADKQLTLTVNGKPTMTGAREVKVKPIASEENVRYFNWVEQRRRYVDSVSGGKIGYIHIPDMGEFGLTRFTKMFYNQMRKPGLIVDVRYNGGGFVADLVLERLRRQVVAMGFSRSGAPGPAPDDALNAHMITLQNEFSVSDGDYFPYYFREYKLGPLMGTRTWGGVVGYRGSDPLVDGGYYVVPEFTIYNLQSQWVMENVGVVPDMPVDNPPEHTAKGIDDQLDSAIAYISKKLKEDPKTLPPPPGPPTPR
jgi:tricorn protease